MKNLCKKSAVFFGKNSLKFPRKSVSSERCVQVKDSHTHTHTRKSRSYGINSFLLQVTFLLMILMFGYSQEKETGSIELINFRTFFKDKSPE